MVSAAVRSLRCLPPSGRCPIPDLGRQIVGKMISPIYYVTSSLPPVLIVHGDADVVVPLQQSESFAAKAKEVGAPDGQDHCAQRQRPRLA